MNHKKKIGLMGGTFDPIHHGHLVAAESAREAYGLDRVLFIPTGDPPHKKDRRITAAKHRLSMLELACSGNSDFVISTIELERQGTTYTVDTLTDLRAAYPRDELHFIIGGDTLLEIGGWMRFPEVASLCSFIVYHRPGTLPAVARQEAKRLQDAAAAKIQFLEGLNLEISSMDIRSRAAHGKSIRYLVPQAVEEYIKRFHLY